MKKNKKIYLLVFVSILLIMLAFMGSQTYSKYLTKVNGKGVIQIAKWSFLVNGENSTMQNIQLLKSYDTTKLVENKIAPGCKGSFTIQIDATGTETALAYYVKFENETSKPKNLRYECEGKTVNNLKELETVLNGNIQANEEKKLKEYVINWSWNYETGIEEQEIREQDVIDTQNAISIAEYSFDVIVTGTQLEPA